MIWSFDDDVDDDDEDIGIHRPKWLEFSSKSCLCFRGCFYGKFPWIRHGWLGYLLLQSLDPPTIDPDEIHGRGAAAAMAMGEKRAFFFEEINAKNE